MKLIDLIVSAKSSNQERRKISFNEIYNRYREFIVKTFLCHSPFTDASNRKEFAAELALEFYKIIQERFNNFRLKKKYTDQLLEDHLWNYFQGIIDSILDKKLIEIWHNEESAVIKNCVQEILIQRYADFIESAIFQKIQTNETPQTKKLQGFELEQFWDGETQKLADRFIQKKIPKLVQSFEYKHNFVIFRNYLQSTLSNFLRDYFRGKSVKFMRRILLYREEFPDELFSILKDLKGHGNLFYYKKLSDCLSIRDVKKCIMVIKNLQLRPDQFRKIIILINKAQKRAEYQKIIEKLVNYVREKCSDKNCEHLFKVSTAKILLYAGDEIMCKRKKINQNQIDEASENMKKCIKCIDPEFQHRDIFLP